MPKRKWTKLHDDVTIANERRHRSLRLREQHDARVTIVAAVDDLRDDPRSMPPEELEPGDKPPGDRRKGE